MNLRQLSTFFFLLVTASLGYGASASGGGAMLAPDDFTNPSRTSQPSALVIKNPNASIPGGNAFEVAGSPAGSVAAPGAVVPEPSTIALLCVSALGFGALKLRRRRSAE